MSNVQKYFYVQLHAKMGAAMNDGASRKRAMIWGLTVLGLSTVFFGVKGRMDGDVVIGSRRSLMFSTGILNTAADRDETGKKRLLLMLDDDSPDAELDETQAPTQVSSQETIKETTTPTHPPDPPTAVPTETPTLRPTNKPSARPTNTPTSSLSSSPTRRPTPSPTNRPAMGPSSMPVALSFSEKMQQGLNYKALGWSLFIPVAAVSIIILVHQRAKKKRRVIQLNESIVDGAIPGEIIFANELIYPRLEMASASTWRTSDEWSGTEQETLPSVPSKEESYLTTDFDEMQ